MLQLPVIVMQASAVGAGPGLYHAQGVSTLSSGASRSTGGDEFVAS